MMQKKYIITDILLKDTSIKNLINHYSDSSKTYNHTLRNLLKIKNIKHDNNDIIKVQYLVLITKKIREYNINDILDKHTTELYSFL